MQERLGIDQSEMRMVMSMSDIAGFWSYVHTDNENAGGAIERLADRVMNEYALLSGEPLKLLSTGISNGETSGSGGLIKRFRRLRSLSP
jgi:hypothetical protein